MSTTEPMTDAYCGAAREEAFGRLVHAHQERLLSLVTGILGSPEDAEDTVQDTMLSAFRGFDRFQGRSEIYTWLYRIAINQCVNHRRKQRATQSLDWITDAQGSEPIAEGSSPSRPLELREQARMVDRAMRRLPEEYRTILLLREFDQFAYDLIAKQLDLNAGTVRSRLHRARAQLRKEINHIDGQASG